MEPFGFQTRDKCEVNWQQATYAHEQRLAVGKINSRKSNIMLQIFVFREFDCNLLEPSVDVSILTKLNC
jgi:hypothetical protein